MELKDSTKEYLVDQIQQYYTNEADLRAIFALYKNAFGQNFYGNIEGNNFNAKIHYLVVELSKDSGTKLEKFIEITKRTYPEFAKYFNFPQESLIHLLDEMFKYDKKNVLNAYQFFISKQKNRNGEKPTDGTQLINSLIKLTEEQQTHSCTELFVGYLLEIESELSVSLKQELRKWAEKYIKNYAELIEQFAQEKRDLLILRKTWLFLKDFWMFPLLIATFILFKFNTNPPEYISSNSVVTETPMTTMVPSVTPEDFVKNYFSDIQNGEYQKAYDSLSLRYKKSDPDTYTDYVNWWYKDVEQVHIEYIDVISKNASSARVDVDLRLFMRKTKKITFSNIILSLIWDAQNDKWLIDKSEIGSKGVRNQS